MSLVRAPFNYLEQNSAQGKYSCHLVKLKLPRSVSKKLMTECIMKSKLESLLMEVSGQDFLKHVR